jgi:DNA repair exonuclease SbcCD nuclease subunit
MALPKVYSMRILLFSDLHAHAFKPYSEMLPDGSNSRLQDAINILEQIGNICKDYKVDGVLCAGDLFHTRYVIQVPTFNAIYEAIAKIKMQVMFFGLLVGNHDQGNRKGDIYSTETLRSIVTVMDEPKWYVFGTKEAWDQVLILGLPFNDSKEALKMAIEEGINQPNMKPLPRALLAHIGLSGAKAGANFVMISNNELTVPDLKPEAFQQVFLGHYHMPQNLTPNVRYLGATHQHNWGDQNQERGCWLWDTDPRSKQEFSEPKMIPLRAPKFVKVPYDTVLNPKHTKLDEMVAGNFVQVVCPIDLEMDDWLYWEKRILDWGARKVEQFIEPSKTPTMKQATFHPGMDYETMVDRYVELSSMDDTLKPGLVDLGKEILTKVTT